MTFGDDEDTYVEPKNPYVEVRVVDVATGEDVIPMFRVVNGDTVTVRIKRDELVHVEQTTQDHNAQQEDR